MPGWYNAPKDGAKFASIAFSDFASVNTQIEFDELRFTRDDDFYYLFFHATKVTDIVKMGDKDWKWKEELGTLKIARKDYEKWNSKEQKKIPTAQSRVEKLVCKLLEDKEPAETYKGFLQLQDGNGIDAILTGTQNGKDITAMVPMLMETYASFEVCDPDKIADSDVGVPAKKSGGGGYGAKSQTELEKLNDRFSFIKAQLKIVTDTEVTTVADICEVLKGEKSDLAVAVYATCIELMK